MAKDILGEFGPESRGKEVGRATSGGCTECKELPYSPPQGPTGQMKQGPGLGGANHGSCGTQGKY